MLVKTILDDNPREIITIDLKATIEDAMEMLITNKISCLPVIDSNKKLTGIISDKDIFKNIHKTKGKYHHLTVTDMMTTDLIVGLPEDEISYIAGLMTKNWIRHVPILSGDKLVGMVSQRDIIRTQALDAEIENRYLQLYMTGLSSRDLSG